MTLPLRLQAGSYNELRWLLAGMAAARKRLNLANGVTCARASEPLQRSVSGPCHHAR